ncbi:uncharacterized protein LOC109822432 [Asparagus officinalis]|uniref:uncharacterized protein LOC109822432 n=1 Tax=Asparagus officinalis TaxID=4686 RepID=UPI00098E5914|nr:uncharacterized protein LOC109822432 [Asparagus officinalis]
MARRRGNQSPAWRQLLCLALNNLKSLFTDDHNNDHYVLHYYNEHELSFDETPNFRSKKKYRRPTFPCIDPPVADFDDEEDDDADGEYFSQLKEESKSNDEGEGEKGIDVKAEEFISRFYDDMKLQRELSCLRYNEMLYRGMS